MDIYIYYIVPQIINFLMAVLIIPAIYITKIILKRDFFHSSDETIINLFIMKRNSLWVRSGILLLPPILMMMLQYLNYAILLAYGGNVDVSSTLIQFQILYGLINSINIFLGILIILWALIITKKLNLWVFALITTSIFFLWSKIIIGEILLPAN